MRRAAITEAQAAQAKTKASAPAVPDPGVVESPNVDIFGDVIEEDQEGEEEAEQVEDAVEDWPFSDSNSFFQNHLSLSQSSCTISQILF